MARSVGDNICVLCRSWVGAISYSNPCTSEEILLCNLRQIKEGFLYSSSAIYIHPNPAWATCRGASHQVMKNGSVAKISLSLEKMESLPQDNETAAPFRRLPRTKSRFNFSFLNLKSATWWNTETFREFFTAYVVRGRLYKMGLLGAEDLNTHRFRLPMRIPTSQFNGYPFIIVKFNNPDMWTR